MNTVQTEQCSATEQCSVCYSQPIVCWLFQGWRIHGQIIFNRATEEIQIQEEKKNCHEIGLLERQCFGSSLQRYEFIAYRILHAMECR